MYKLKKKFYKKHNSFEHLLLKSNAFSKETFIKNIVEKFKLQKKKMSKNNATILKNIINDLTSKNQNKENIFKI